MIKFFRKIRYDLIGKNKTGKYLKYAIGEVLLVVIGILIALSINNWNNNRQNNIKKIEIYTSMKNELQSINKSLLVENNKHKDIYNNCKIFLEMIYSQKNKHFKTSLHKNFWGIFRLPGENITFQSYQNILNTNKLELIKDKNILFKLGEISTAIQGKKVAIDWQNSQWNTINQPFLNNYVEMTEFAFQDNSKIITIPQNNEFKTDFQSLYKSQEFRNIIYNRLLAADDIHRANARLIKIINETIISLNNKLK